MIIYMTSAGLYMYVYVYVCYYGENMYTHVSIYSMHVRTYMCNILYSIIYTYMYVHVYKHTHTCTFYKITFFIL